MTLLKIIFINYAGMFTTIISVTMILNLFSSEYIHIVPLYLPGISTETSDGFELNTIWQFSATLYSTIGFAFFHGLNAFLVLHVLLLSNILCNKVRIISRMAAETPFPIDIHSRMKSVVVLHIEMQSYV